MAPIVPTPRLQTGPAKVLRLALQALGALLISLLVGIAAAPVHAQVRVTHVDAHGTGSLGEVVSVRILEDSGFVNCGTA